eukprot:7219757-Prymnesium_polylepis.1
MGGVTLFEIARQKGRHSGNVASYAGAAVRGPHALPPMPTRRVCLSGARILWAIGRKNCAREVGPKIVNPDLSRAHLLTPTSPYHSRY